MIDPRETMCLNCKSCLHTKISMQVDRGGAVVRFRLDCKRCGSFSHYLKNSEVQKAAKEYLQELFTQLAAALSLADIHPIIRKVNESRTL